MRIDSSFSLPTSTSFQPSLKGQLGAAPQRQSSFSSTIENRSEQALGLFDSLGEWYGGVKTRAFEDLSSLSGNGLSTYSNVREVEKGFVQQIRENPTDVVRRYSERAVKTSPKIRILAKGANFFNATTGILEAAHTFHLERKAGSTTFPKTLGAFVSSSVQIMAGGAVGALAFSAAAAGAPAALALGGAVVLGGAVSFGVGKISSWIFG
ncbi:MAG: hypothetical protein KDD64_14675 [Bdellovibrionales bacterium]|nr:hypothetical protein [Bdellovibrionales bacterium]